MNLDSVRHFSIFFLELVTIKAQRQSQTIGNLKKEIIHLAKIGELRTEESGNATPEGNKRSNNNLRFKLSDECLIELEFQVRLKDHEI